MINNLLKKKGEKVRLQLQQLPAKAHKNMDSNNANIIRQQLQQILHQLQGNTTATSCTIPTNAIHQIAQAFFYLHDQITTYGHVLPPRPGGGAFAIPLEVTTGDCISITYDTPTLVVFRKPPTTLLDKRDPQFERITLPHFVEIPTKKLEPGGVSE